MKEGKASKEEKRKKKRVIRRSVPVFSRDLKKWIGKLPSIDLYALCARPLIYLLTSSKTTQPHIYRSREEKKTNPHHRNEKHRKNTFS